MEKIHSASLANALIWAAAIIATAVILRGTEHAGIVVVILGGAAGAIQDRLAEVAPGSGEDSAADVRRWRETRS